MGVARRTQRQFPMPPRALPPGRMGLLSPSGIGGISPRHALTSPSLGGQGRQVSQLEAKSLALLGWGGGACDVCVHMFVSRWAQLSGEVTPANSATPGSGPLPYPPTAFSLPMPHAEPVVRQPWRQQQYAQPEPQLCAAHSLAPSPLVTPGHSHVPSR